jgi:hypothetical protein
MVPGIPRQKPTGNAPTQDYVVGKNPVCPDGGKIPTPLHTGPALTI